MKRTGYLLVCVLSGLSLFTGVALAEEGAGKPMPGGDRAQRCAENPQKCEEMKARLKEKCAQDPKRCEEMKAHMVERKAKCDANPEACKEQREKMRAKRKECKENPEKCKRPMHGKGSMGQSDKAPMNKSTE